MFHPIVFNNTLITSWILTSCLSNFTTHLYSNRLNWTPLSPIIITCHPKLHLYSLISKTGSVVQGCISFKIIKCPAFLWPFPGPLCCYHWHKIEKWLKNNIESIRKQRYFFSLSFLNILFPVIFRDKDGTHHNFQGLENYNVEFLNFQRYHWHHKPWTSYCCVVVKKYPKINKTDAENIKANKLVPHVSFWLDVKTFPRNLYSLVAD